MNQQDQNALYQRWMKSDDPCPPDELMQLSDEEAALEAALIDEDVVETLANAMIGLIRSRLPRREAQ